MTDAIHNGPIRTVIVDDHALEIGLDRALILHLNLFAVNDVTRAAFATPCTLTHDEAEYLGEECIHWIGRRFGVTVTTSDQGVHLTPERDS